MFRCFGCPSARHPFSPPPPAGQPRSVLNSVQRCATLVNLLCALGLARLYRFADTRKPLRTKDLAQNRTAGCPIAVRLTVLAISR